MEQVFGFGILLMFSACVYSLPVNTHVLQQNISIESESLDRLDQDLPEDSFAWAKGNESCASLRKECLDYLFLLPPVSTHFIKPALVLGMMKVGCLLETDQLYIDLLKDQDTREIYELLDNQIRNFDLQPSNHNAPKHSMQFEILKFNLDSLHPTAFLPLQQNCSGFHEKQNAILNGLSMGVHKTVQEARTQCRHLGSSCAGVSSNSGRYYTVARNGGYIMPQKGSTVWLHHCNIVYRWKRSTAPECTYGTELRVHRVMEWIPVVSGWYNAGSAIFYATQGCSELAEDRAIEASTDLGYDAVVSATGGSVNVVTAGVGLAVKPAIKSGVKKAISYFKSESQK